jgi:TolB-like protein
MLLKAVGGHIMKLLHLRIMISFLILIASYSFSGPLTLAVLDFENRSFMEAEKYAPLSQGLAEMMITELSQVQSIQMVERRRLREMLDELKMAQSGMTDTETSVQVGKMLGAKHLVFGSYMVISGDQIRIDLRVVEVETGRNLKAAEITGKTKQVLSLIKKLSKKILDDFSIALTGEENTALSQGKSVDMKAVMLFSEGLGFEDQNNLREAYARYKQALQIEPDFFLAKNAIKRITEEKKQEQMN